MTLIKAVIFDLDGTLANTIPLCLAAFRKAVEPLVHRPLSDEEIISHFGPDEEGTIRALAPDDFKKGTSDFMRLYESMHDMCTHPFDGVEEVLHTLQKKGVHLALATGKGKYTTQLTLKRLGLASYFSVVETGSPKGSRKPEAIQEIIHFFPAIKKEEIIYVGDSAGDIKDSRKAGIAVVAAAWADTAKKDELKALHPDQMFYTVADFARWIDANT